MMIELHHPQHGVKHAYSDQEVALDEKNGWKKVSGTTVVPADESIPQVADAREVLVAAYRQKFGKKPHHKMKIETIREALK